MDVKELRDAKNELESDLKAMVGRRLAEFREQTGYHPSSVSVEMMEFTAFGDAVREFQLDLVKVKLDIF